MASQVALMVNKLPAKAGDVRGVGLLPGPGRSPGYSLWVTVTESQTKRKQLSMQTCTPAWPQQITSKMILSSKVTFWDAGLWQINFGRQQIHLRIFTPFPKSFFSPRVHLLFLLVAWRSTKCTHKRLIMICFSYKGQIMSELHIPSDSLAVRNNLLLCCFVRWKSKRNFW